MHSCVTRIAVPGPGRVAHRAHNVRRPCCSADWRPPPVIMHAGDVILSEVHMESAPPGMGAWTTRFQLSLGRRPHVLRRNSSRRGLACAQARTKRPLAPSSSSGTSADSSSTSSTSSAGGPGGVSAMGEDGDEDLSPPRKRPRPYIQIGHARSTTLAGVGMQVRRTIGHLLSVCA